MMHINLHNRYTYEEGILAYLDYRKHKRMTYSQQEFEVNYESTVEKLIDSLNNETYEISPSTIFVVTVPKVRIVIAAKPIDRVVHHLITRDLMPQWERTFIPDSCACIKDRGTLYASERLRQHLRIASQGFSKPVYTASVDIKNFFVSICKPILWMLLASVLTDGKNLTSRITKKIVFNDPRINPIFRPNTDLSLVPRHKNIFNQDDLHGLPIGNITSQFFANVYLDGLDKFVKHKLHIKHYVRYVDDAVLIDKDRERLKDAVMAMDDYLKTERDLMLHPDKIKIAPAKAGVNFVGRVILPHCVLPRPSLVKSAKAAASRVFNHPTDYDALCSLNSYLGLLTQTDSWRLRKSLCESARVPYVNDFARDYSKMFLVSPRIL